MALTPDTGLRFVSILALLHESIRPHQSFAFQFKSLQEHASSDIDDLTALHGLRPLRVLQATDTERFLPGPWRAAELDESDASERNLCIDGKLVPELYILGAPKAATTALAFDLMGAGVKTVGEDCRNKHLCLGNTTGPHPPYKEFHFHEVRGRWDEDAWRDDGFAVERQKWLSVFKPCSWANGKRLAYADFTPENARMVPMPPGTQPVGSFLLRQVEPELMDLSSTRGVNLPLRLQRFYGPSYQHRMRFVVMLREPVSRLQSLYYCCMQCRPGQSCEPASFRTFLGRAVDLATQPIPHYEDFMWGSMYGLHLEEWLKHFDASQFLIVPFNLYAGQSTAPKDDVCRALSASIDYRMNCTFDGSFGADDVRFNRGQDAERSAVSDDVGEALSKRFEEEIARPDRDRLIRLLTTAHRAGAYLAGYSTIQTSEADIGSWLQTNW